MIQIAAVLVSIGLVILGIKGFTAKGIPVSKNKTLTGNSGQVVGTLCILAGVAFCPALLAFIWLYGMLFGL